MGGRAPTLAQAYQRVNTLAACSLRIEALTASRRNDAARGSAFAGSACTFRTLMRTYYYRTWRKGRKGARHSPLCVFVGVCACKLWPRRQAQAPGDNAPPAVRSTRCAWGGWGPPRASRGTVKGKPPSGGKRSRRVSPSIPAAAFHISGTVSIPCPLCPQPARRGSRVASPRTVSLVPPVCVRNEHEGARGTAPCQAVPGPKHWEVAMVTMTSRRAPPGTPRSEASLGQPEEAGGAD